MKKVGWFGSFTSCIRILLISFLRPPFPYLALNAVWRCRVGQVHAQNQKSAQAAGGWQRRPRNARRPDPAKRHVRVVPSSLGCDESHPVSSANTQRTPIALPSVGFIKRGTLWCFTSVTWYVVTSSGVFAVEQNECGCNHTVFSQVLAKRLRELADEHDNVVAIVGKDHVEGIQNLWDRIEHISVDVRLHTLATDSCVCAIYAHRFVSCMYSTCCIRNRAPPVGNRPCK